MKRVYNGKIFDTEKSTKLCELSMGSIEDFNFIGCKLYVSPRSHTFFLAGKGGPMSIFSKTNPDGTTYGTEGIIPITGEMAFQYMKRENVPMETIKKYLKA